jgi:hypothetical protein
LLYKLALKETNEQTSFINDKSVAGSSTMTFVKTENKSFSVHETIIKNLS